MADRYDLVVIGLGSGGMIAAPFAARLGLKVAAVERARVGGDCLWTGCVPSKALLASAKVAHHARTGAAFGVHSEGVTVDRRAVWQRVREIQHQIASAEDSPEAIVASGVELVIGTARLSSPDCVEVDGPDGVRRLPTRFVLICTGSRPAVPAVPGLADAGFLTSENVWDVDDPPASVVVLGGGPVAVELAQAFNRLGIATTVLQRGASVLPRDEPDLARRVADALRAEGVELLLDVAVDQVRRAGDSKVVHARAHGSPVTCAAEEVLVATGRAANVEGLGLRELGVRVGPRGVEVDDRLRTSVPGISAAGDVAGRALFTHAAAHEAVLAVRNMFFPGRTRARASIPWVTYCDPELAHAGFTEAEARRRFRRGVAVHVHELSHNDRARTEGATRGAMVLVTAKGKLVGASVLAPGAGELIGELNLAIERKLGLDDLASVVHAYPTISTGLSLLAGEVAFRKADKYRWLIRRR